MKLLYCIDSIYKAPWELFGILFAVGLAYAAWKNFRGNRGLCITILSGLIFAAVWRGWFAANSPRYYNIFIFPALFFSFYLIWHGPWPRKISCSLLLIVIGICTVKDLRYNPYDREIVSMYQQVRQDAQKYQRPAGLSFTKLSAKERFYTGLPISGNERQSSLDYVLTGLKGNFSIFDGNYDVVYCFIEFLPNTPNLDESLLDLAPPGAVTVMSKTYLDRKQKKGVAVIRYSAAAPSAIDEADKGEPVTNGDFSQLLDPDKLKRSVAYFGQRSPRFLQEAVSLPAKWTLYQSLMQNTESLANVISTPNGNALSLEANGSYLAAGVPVALSDRTRYLNFNLRVKRESYLQITREIHRHNQKGELIPILTMRLLPGMDRRYEVRLAAWPDAETQSLWFWLHSGEIELSDVRIK